jgi:hypothetical protein
MKGPLVKGICTLALLGLSQHATAQEAPTSQPTSMASSQPSTQPASTPATVPVEPVKPIEKPKKPEDPKPSKGLSVGSQGKISFGALLQGWYDTNQTADKFTQNDDAIDTFRVRRAEINITGEIIPKKFGFKVMTDLAKGLFNQDKQTVVTGVTTTTDPVTGEVTTTTTTSTITGVKADNIVPVRDLYGIVKTKNVDVWFGQYKIPLSLEGLGSPAQLLLPERAVASKTFGDKRDFGIKAEKRFDKFQNAYYAVGIWNGSGENKLDTDSVKDFMWRFEAIPQLGPAKVLVAFVGAQSLTGDDLQASRQLFEGDLRVNVGPLVVQSEVFSQTSRNASANGIDPAADKKAFGFYASGGFQQKNFLAALRVGSLDPDTATAPEEDGGQLLETGASASYFFWRDSKKTSPLFSDHPEIHEAKIQLGYSHFVPTKTGVGTTDEVILAMQSWF